MYCGERRENMRVKILTERSMGERVKKWLLSQGETIVDKNPELLIICYYGRILSDEELREAPMGTINFHPGLLPLNRGMHPQIWPLVDGSPAGVTLHWVTKEIDCGPIIAQKKFKVEPTDIVSDMDRKSQDTIFRLFKKMWPKIKSGKAPRMEQKGPSSRHYNRDIKTICEFDKATIGRLRACTYKDKSYGYFIDNGKKIYIGVKFYN